MPGSQQDRCTFAHEKLFLLTKRPRYYFDIYGVRTQSGAPLRNVWRINTRSYKEAHFACFPPELPSRCVRLGTSAKGCCPACGAPWRRRVEKDRKATRPGQRSKVNRAREELKVNCTPGLQPVGASSTLGNVVGNRDPERHVTATRTVGWEPTCACPPHEPRPCVILDPFAGSGTTGEVCGHLGRHFVGLDLNGQYLRDFAVRRCRRGERPHAAEPVVSAVNAHSRAMPLFPEESAR